MGAIFQVVLQMLCCFVAVVVGLAADALLFPTLVLQMLLLFLLQMLCCFVAVVVILAAYALLFLVLPMLLLLLLWMLLLL